MLVCLRNGSCAHSNFCLNWSNRFSSSHVHMSVLMCIGESIISICIYTYIYIIFWGVESNIRFCFVVIKTIEVIIEWKSRQYTSLFGLFFISSVFTDFKYLCGNAWCLKYCFGWIILEFTPCLYVHMYEIE